MHPTRSGNLDFFAAAADQAAVLEFLFGSTDVRVFESYSMPDREIREFRSLAELSAAYPLGLDPQGSGDAVLLALWSPSVMRDLTIERFKLEPSVCDGCTFRHKITGGALMQLYFGGLCGRVLTKSHFGHQSQSRAEAWGWHAGIDWGGLKRVSNQILYHMRRRLAVGKADGRLVLADAMRLVADGYCLKESTQTDWEYTPEPISRKPRKSLAQIR